MPYRYEPCVTQEIYHVFNRSVAGQTIFPRNHDYERFLDLINYYRFENPSVRFSEYKRLSVQAKKYFFEQLQANHDQVVTILAFCCMPNHFHLLLKQQKDPGISRFTAQLQNGYAKYFNIKTKRFGAVFQSMFKAVHVEDDDQLIHVARYIHLNPLTAGIVENSSELVTHPYDSFGNYLRDDTDSMLEKTTILSMFKDRKSFQSYTLDQAEYQRLLFVESHLYHDADPHTGGV